MAQPRHTDPVAKRLEREFEDTFTAWVVEADDTTPDEYDTTQTEVYGPNTDPHVGAASISEDTSGIARNDDGGETPDADAVVTLPLVSENIEDDLLDSKCEGTFRGKTRQGRVISTSRGEITILLTVEWT